MLDSEKVQKIVELPLGNSSCRVNLLVRNHYLSVEMKVLAEIMAAGNSSVLTARSRPSSLLALFLNEINFGQLISLSFAASWHDINEIPQINWS